MIPAAQRAGLDPIAFMDDFIFRPEPAHRLASDGHVEKHSANSSECYPAENVS